MKFIFTDLEDEMKKTVEEVILKITDNKALRKLMCRYYLMYKYIIIIIIFFFFLFLFLLIYIQLYLFLIYISYIYLYVVWVVVQQKSPLQHMRC